jgi:hypothetical protein
VRSSGPWRPGARLTAADLVIISFLGLITGQLARVPVAGVDGKEAPLILTDLLVGLVLTGGSWLLIHERRIDLDRVALVTLAFSAVGALSAVASVPRFGLSLGEVLFSLAYLSRWLWVFGLYVVVTNCIGAHEVERVWGWLERAALAFAGFGIVQAALLPDFALSVYPEARPYLDWDPQGHRLVSTLLDPNFSGMVLSAVLLVQVGRLAFGVSVPRWKVLLVATALVLTLSRSSVVATLTGIGVILLVRGTSRRLWVSGALLATGAAITSPWWVPFAISFNKFALDDPSGLYRVIQWGWALTVIMDHPIAGIGFNAYGFVHQRYGFSTSTPSTFGLDGGILFIAVMTGVLGLALFCLVLVLLMRSARVGWERSDLPPQLRGIALGAGALVPAVTVHSLFANSLLYIPVLHILWILWGCAFVVAASPRNEQAGPVLTAIGGGRETVVGLGLLSPRSRPDLERDAADGKIVLRRREGDSLDHLGTPG